MKRGTLKVFGCEYESNESGTIYAQIFDENENPSINAIVTLSLLKSDGTKILDKVKMEHIKNSNGIYKYDFITPAYAGNYICDISSKNPIAFGADEVRVERSAIRIKAIEDYTEEIGLMRKLQTNRLELTEGKINNWVLYDDDNVTPLLTFSVSDKSNEAIIIIDGAPTKRGKGT